jgi:hypothetical protein
VHLGVFLGLGPTQIRRERVDCENADIGVCLECRSQRGDVLAEIEHGRIIGAFGFGAGSKNGLVAKETDRSCDGRDRLEFDGKAEFGEAEHELRDDDQGCTFPFIRFGGPLCAQPFKLARCKFLKLFERKSDLRVSRLRCPIIIPQ